MENTIDTYKIKATASILKYTKIRICYNKINPMSIHNLTQTTTSKVSTVPKLKQDNKILTVACHKDTVQECAD